MTEIAQTPTPPYYAVIFTNVQTEDLEGYADMADKMEQLAKQQSGYLGFESARNELGIAVSYWTDLESIKNWRSNIEHSEAQRLGRTQWYSRYKVRIALIERDYSLED